MKSLIYITSLVLLILLNSFTNTACCQSAEKQNPIIFTEGFIGYSGGKAGGLSGGLQLNYQPNKSFFSFRYIETVKLLADVVAPLVPIPFITEKSNLHETAILYGWRFINNANAYSFSVGVSYNKFSEFSTDINIAKSTIITKYAGLPFEANVNFFKKEKRRLRIYGLIPVGKPTSLGNSIGFKFFGNISKHTYAGVGITFGFGYFKNY